MTLIFQRTMILAMVGGMGIGALFVLQDGWEALIAIPLGAVAGFPLGILAGCVLAVVGGLLLVPYRGPVVALTTVSALASCLVMAYLSLGLTGMAGIGRAEGQPDSSDPGLGWLRMTASMAAAVLSPWVVWWYVKRMETSPTSAS